MKHTRAALLAHNEELQTDNEELHALMMSLTKILDATILVVRGPPPPLTMYGWHDLAERVQALKNELTELKAAARGVAEELIEDVNQRWGAPDVHPANQRKYDRDLSPAVQLLKLLAPPTPLPEPTHD